MRIILLKDIENLGKINEVKEVADGYARNFLFPRGLAVFASKNRLLALKRKLEREAKKLEAELKKAKELAKKLAGFKLEISSKVGKTGKLFGSITPLKIAKLLSEKDFDIKKEQVILKEPIKKVGEYPVEIDFGHDIKAKIGVVVVKERN